MDKEAWDKRLYGRVNFPEMDDARRELGIHPRSGRDLSDVSGWEWACGILTDAR
jgi:hypothetical protein